MFVAVACALGAGARPAVCCCPARARRRPRAPAPRWRRPTTARRWCSTRPGSPRPRARRSRCPRRSIQYAMEFTRRGTYDADARRDLSVRRTAVPDGDRTTRSPPLGIGSFQPVPVIAVLDRPRRPRAGPAPRRRPLRAERVSVPRHVRAAAAGCQKYVFNTDPNRRRRHPLRHHEAGGRDVPAVDRRVVPHPARARRRRCGCRRASPTSSRPPRCGAPRRNYEENVKDDGCSRRRHRQLRARVRASA